MKISWSVGLLIIILATSFGIMATVSVQESAIMDELAHIPAGYGYAELLDYRLNPEHPPLVKMISALPLAFMDFNFPTGSTAWKDDVNGQWVMGTQFLYESGNDADRIIQAARVGPMILTLMLIAFVYLWSRKLLGQWWALLPTVFTAFSPTILAHGHYVTTDVGATLGVIVALYFFVEFLQKRTGRSLIFAGLAFGFAQLLKFSTLVLIPVFVVLAIIYWWRSQRQEAWRVFRSLILIFFIGFLFVYPFYFVTTLNYPIEKQAADTEFILSSFANGPAPEGEICKPMRCLAELNIWMANNPVLRPFAQYMLGVLMVIQRSAGGNTAYFLGEVSSSGSPLYFPAVYLMKEALPTLILAFSALLYALYRGVRGARPRLPELAMMLFVFVYAIYSITSPLNIGVRHLLPVAPLIYILTAVGLRGFAEELGVRMLGARKILLGGIGILVVWFLVSVGRAYPHYLPYFNEAIGTDNGWRYVTDSNYDWGQDLKRLKTFVDENNIGKIAVDYFGGGNPQYYLGDKALQWQSAKGPVPKDIKWLAVSVGYLQNAKGTPHPKYVRNQEEEYRWLENYEEPYARAGRSIFIYKLD